jgi:hypothetical protein
VDFVSGKREKFQKENKAAGFPAKRPPAGPLRADKQRRAFSPLSVCGRFTNDDDETNEEHCQCGNNNPFHQTSSNCLRRW